MVPSVDIFVEEMGFLFCDLLFSLKKSFCQGIKIHEFALFIMVFKVQCTVKPVLSGHSRIDKTKVLKTNGSLMKVESIAECSLGAFCNTFDLH